MVIKNYKELCKLIDEPVKTGEAKQNQINKLAELVEFHKEGNKFIIDNKKVVGNFANYTTIKSNSNILVEDMAKKTTTFDKNENEVIWSKGQDKSIITNEDIYFEGEDEDELFFQIEKNKHKLKLYNYYTY